jgi:hypothetical protein
MWRVKVYLPDRREPGRLPGTEVWYTGWTYLIAHTRTLIGWVVRRPQSGDKYPIYHYTGQYADGSAWYFSEIEACVGLGDVTIEAGYVRRERILNGPRRLPGEGQKDEE